MTEKSPRDAVGPDLERERGQKISAKRSKAEPITGRNHPYNAAAYVYRHIFKGADVNPHVNAERWLGKMGIIK